jgi:phosphohistidine swiveling domain-containing protein
MMDTILNIGREPDPWNELVRAIDTVFDSWMSERAVAYRAHHHVDGLLGTAVTVQTMCPSEVSGVMFTANPVNPVLEQIVIESAPGLGEAMVLGKVTPDHFVLDRKTLGIIERQLAAPDASLNDAQLEELARLGLRVEEYFKTPCDIEWGLSRGQFYLLQARPIKTNQAHGWQSVGDAAEIEKIRQEEIAALRARAEPEGTVWSRFNLAEILPDPTPMTWAIIRSFMSPRGGLGLMYSDLGYDPDAALGEEGSYDLICGRVYCNLSREPRMQSRSLPFAHRFSELKANPAKALYPKPVFNAAGAGWRFWLCLPAVYFRLWRSAARISRLTRTFAARFRDEIVPSFLTEVEIEAAQDYGRLTNLQLVQRFFYWTQRTLTDFARESLKPTALAAIALENLEGTLRRRLEAIGQTQLEPGAAATRAQELLREVVIGVRPEPDADLAEALRNVALERMDRDVFVARFGHRGQKEMELACPRWSEDPIALGLLIAETRAALSERHDPCHADARAAWLRIVDETKLPAYPAAALEREVDTLRTYLGLRESAKHYLLQGYALMRRALVELDRRFDLDGGIFFLLPHELPEPGRPELKEEIGRRRRRRELALRIPVPQVLFSDDLDAIGRVVEHTGDGAYQGVPLSAGVAEGLALVLDEPRGAALPSEPYILVCPSTDPAWVPLFVNARGLVMETGGVLSHGAIVAREFGLPAVAGLPDIHRRLRTGQRLRIDGATGRVNVLA